MAIKAQTQKQSKRIMLSLLVLVFLGWLILLAWVLSLWEMSGFDRAWQAIYELSKQQTTAVAGFNDASVAEYFKSWFMELPTIEITEKLTKASSMIKNELNTVLPNENSELDNLAKDLFYTSRHVWILVGLTAHVMLIKLMILLAAIPLFTLAAVAGLVDGLNQRAIRTASLGRESSYVFHQLNRYFKRGLLILLTLWLAIPVSITPALMFVPVSILLSVMVSITASRFKKYL
ncbi:TIGR03747 family integrating conjugative element membrane protein [Legionella sp.]|uniref:TIGR03747 family integrating conjugative element membrane protein n=1 Tax=Legionella sp. TaxID=459 RepID=UPI000CBBC381|nr:TIGR03747 family integrating conjugative element membrane protein [Legionella sp.]PJE14674.1 MAG: TIGR03747 family integrating conjugative element membrane protein [Legionella sp.]